MFRRLLLEDSAAWFTLVAFITAVSVFIPMLWRALRMPRHQVARFAALPFASEQNPPARHESRS